MAHKQTQTEWEEEMSKKILTFVRHELYLDLRFMEPALSAFAYRRADGLLTLASNGVCLFFSVEPTLRIFEKNSRFLNRAYLHSALHCLFRHLWQTGGRNLSLFYLACDIAVEFTIDTLEKESVKRALSWLRLDVYNSLKSQDTAVSAATVYRFLQTCSQEKIEALKKEFYTDDHRFWPKENEMQTPCVIEARKNWDKIARQTSLEKKRKGEDAGEGEKIFSAQIRAGAQRRSYRKFLRKFAVLLEETQLDLDEFDLGSYSYGLRLYGNLPFVEPLETKETHKIREFVIVIDTSDSTSGALVEGFLKETYSILTESHSFSGRFTIRILQCDDKVQTDDTVHNQKELAQWMETMQITGGGGTNFCPAFAYINELAAKGAGRLPDGLLYFTDGKGIYPKTKPKYRTAFLYLDEYDDAAAPPWAMRLKLNMEEFLDEH